MRGPLRRCSLPALTLVCLSLVLTASAAPVAFPVRHTAARPLAGIPKLAKPLTPAQFLHRISMSRILSQALASAAREMGVPGKPKPIVLNLPRIPQSKAAAQAGMLPCDYYHGVALSWWTPLAADNLPPKNFASMEITGLYIPNGLKYLGQPSDWAQAAWVKGLMTFQDGMPAGGSVAPVIVTVKFCTQRAGLFAVSVNAPELFYADAKARVVTPTGSTPIPLSGADGLNVLLRLKQNQVGYPKYCEVTWTQRYARVSTLIAGTEILHVCFNKVPQ